MKGECNVKEIKILFKIKVQLTLLDKYNKLILGLYLGERIGHE